MVGPCIQMPLQIWWAIRGPCQRLRMLWTHFWISGRLCRQSSWMNWARMIDDLTTWPKVWSAAVSLAWKCPVSFPKVRSRIRSTSSTLRIQSVPIISRQSCLLFHGRHNLVAMLRNPRDLHHLHSSKLTIDLARTSTSTTHWPKRTWSSTPKNNNERKQSTSTDKRAGPSTWASRWRKSDDGRDWTMIFQWIMII